MPAYSAAAAQQEGLDVIKQREIVDIINALKMQHEFINETERTYQVYS